MKHNHTLIIATLMLALACVFPFRVQAQNKKVKEKAQSEKQVNNEYRKDILDFIKKDVQKRQKQMNKEAYRYLVNLPYDEKLYDETSVDISSQVVEDVDENGEAETNFVVNLSYKCQNIEGTTDDYPMGAYVYDQSNSCRALCTLAKTMIDGVCKDIFREGKTVTIRISSTTDGVEIAHIDYEGEYGDMRYEPAIFNDEPVRISVNQTDGISTNAQLAYVRARSVRNYIENNINVLSRTENKFEYITKCYGEEGSQFRRSSIEIIVHNAFSETMEEMTAKMIQDEYVDFNLPEAEANSNSSTFVLVVANEDYTGTLPTVPFATNDGAMIMKYCQTVLGVPERHIKVINNATGDEIRKGVDWLRDISIAVKGEANIIIYYAGLGISDAEYNPFLIPNGIDCEDIKSINLQDKKTGLPVELSKKEVRLFLTQCISLDTLCNWFRRVQSKSVTLIIDAGFNSVQRSGEPMFNIKKTAKRPRGLRIRSDMVLICASEIDKTAYSFDEQHHGFLTYFILKEWKRTRGEISYKELIDNIDKTLSYESSLQGKLQTPIVIAGGKIKEDWGTRSFR